MLVLYFRNQVSREVRHIDCLRPQAISERTKKSKPGLSNYKVYVLSTSPGAPSK